MKQGEYLQAIADAGADGLSRAELAALTPEYLRYLRSALRSGMVVQLTIGPNARYGLRDPSLVAAIAPAKAPNVREVTAADGDHCNDGGACERGCVRSESAVDLQG